MAKNVPEAEIIQQPEGFYYKEQYREYSRKTKEISTFAWVISFLSLPFSLIPIFGLIFSIFAIRINWVLLSWPIISKLTFKFFVNN